MECPEECLINYDGELGSGMPVRYKIIPGAVKMLVQQDMTAANSRGRSKDVSMCDRFFIVNPVSGSGKSRKLFEELLPQIERSGRSFEWRYTTGRGPRKASWRKKPPEKAANG